MEEVKLRNCPFCRAKVPFMWPWLFHNEEDGNYTLNHFCETSDDGSYFCVSFTAKTKEEIIDRWNGKTD